MNLHRTILTVIPSATEGTTPTLGKECQQMGNVLKCLKTAWTTYSLGGRVKNGVINCLIMDGILSFKRGITGILL